jgi:D-alanyl-D-alanine carboxypeptidase
VDAVCLEALQTMLADCKAAGNYYEFNSAYRSYNTQVGILNSRTKEYMETYSLDAAAARAKALQSVAVPGTSEHHLGLAVDIVGKAAQDWLAIHCWEYGFILRYSGEKAAITGIIDEPWHFRYVGEAAAKEIMDQGICLEEYLGKME